MGYIYVIENTINNKKYVGQTKYPKKRWIKHKNEDIKLTNSLLGSAFRECGVENFEFKIIEECEDYLMDEREIYWIDRLNTYVKNKDSHGYNMTRGGHKLYGEDNMFYGRKHNSVSRSKISDKAKKRVGELNGFYNKKHSEESKLKMSKSHIGKVWDKERRERFSQGQLGANNHFYGKRHSKETKEKIGNANRGRIPYNAIKWEACNENEKIIFLSIGEIMRWLRSSGRIGEDQHFTMSMLKNNLKNAEKNKNKFMEYYWKKSVETIESVDDTNGQEASRVDCDYDTQSKCEDTIL